MDGIVGRRPTPVPTPATEPYWEAAKRKILSIQRCTGCGKLTHPPVQQCPDCRSSSFDWIESSGRGAVYQFTVTHERLVAGFEHAVPYACVLVELQDQPRVFVLANLIGAPASAARIGLPVKVDFEPIDDGFVLPQFRPLGDVSG
jgi:uncharacterized OB-fold protein